MSRAQNFDAKSFLYLHESPKLYLPLLQTASKFFFFLHDNGINFCWGRTWIDGKKNNKETRNTTSTKNREIQKKWEHDIHKTLLVLCVLCSCFCACLDDVWIFCKKRQVIGARIRVDKCFWSAWYKNLKFNNSTYFICGFSVQKNLLLGLCTIADVYRS